MWKSHFSVDGKEYAIHNPCENYCGNLRETVENSSPEIDFRISTGPHRQALWKCEKL